MAKDTTRHRDKNWSHGETMVLAQLRREAGKGKWKLISERFSSSFPDDQGRGADQCRRRWETLVKAYKKVEAHCDNTGKDRRELDDHELASLKWGTKIQWDWYNIVREVRKKRRRDSGRVAAIWMSHGSITAASHSGLPPEHSPARDSLPWLPHASTGESATTSRDAHYEQSSADDVQGLKKRLETEEWSDILEVPDNKIPSEDERAQPIIVPSRVERECPSHHQQYGAVNVAGAIGINMGHKARHVDEFTGFDALPWDTNDSNTLDTFMSQYMSNLKISTASKSTLVLLDGTIPVQPSADNEINQGLETDSDQESDSEISQGLETDSELESDSEEDQPRALQVIELKVFPCCDSCIHKWTKKLEAMDGVEKPVVFDRVNMKVSVTATAEPEDVLKQVQLVKKTAVMWHH